MPLTRGSKLLWLENAQNEAVSPATPYCWMFDSRLMKKCFVLSALSVSRSTKFPRSLAATVFASGGWNLARRSSVCVCVCVCVCMKVCVCFHVAWRKGGVAVGVACNKKAHNFWMDSYNIPTLCRNTHTHTHTHTSIYDASVTLWWHIMPETTNISSDWLQLLWIFACFIQVMSRP